MTAKTKEKEFDCIQLKESLLATMWEKSKATNLEEYAAWLKNETAKIFLKMEMQECQPPKLVVGM